MGKIKDMFIKSKKHNIIECDYCGKETTYEEANVIARPDGADDFVNEYICLKCANKMAKHYGWGE